MKRRNRKRSSKAASPPKIAGNAETPVSPSKISVDSETVERHLDTPCNSEALASSPVIREDAEDLTSSLNLFSDSEELTGSPNVVSEPENPAAPPVAPLWRDCSWAARVCGRAASQDWSTPPPTATIGDERSMCASINRSSPA